MSQNNAARSGPNQAQIAVLDNTRIGLPGRPVRSVEEVKHALLKASDTANILGPVLEVQFIPPEHSVAFQVMYFDPSFTNEQRQKKSNGQWYMVDGGKIALHRNALDALASAAGISTLDSTVVQVEPLLWRAKVLVEMKNLDGTPRRVVRTKEVDLRKAQGEKGFKNMVTHAPAQCETKAYNRAVRACLGIPGAFDQADAGRPFVVPRLMWSPSTDDAEIRRMIAAQNLGIAAQVYGAPKVTGPVVVDTGDYDPNEMELMSPDFVESEPDEPEPVQDEDPWDRPPEDHGPACVVCGTLIEDDRVVDYSTRKFGKILCMKHQPRG